MDDILIATKEDLDKHWRRIHQVLQRLQDHDLYLKPEKCQFHQEEVEYLEVILGQGATRMDWVKVQGILNWPQPMTQKELQAFLGFGNYYKDFISDYSHILKPLHMLTSKKRS